MVVITCIFKCWKVMSFQEKFIKISTPNILVFDSRKHELAVNFNSLLKTPISLKNVSKFKLPYSVIR